MRSEQDLLAQVPLIQWLAMNDVKVPEGIPEPEAVFIAETMIHFNVFGREQDGSLCVVEARALLRVDPPETLRIPKR